MAFYSFPKQIAQEFGRAKVGVWSAAFAYGAIFSIIPLLLVVLSIIGFVYGEQAAQGELVSRLTNVMGAEAAKTIQDAIASAHNSGSNAVAFTVGVFGALLGAAGITSQLQNAFNSILGVVPDPKGGIKRTVYVKAKNVLLVIFGGLVVLVSLTVSTIVAGLGERLQEQFNTPTVLVETGNNLLSLILLWLLLYLLYRTVPDIVVPRKIVAVTALIVTLLFVVGKFVLGFVIANNGTASAYGAAAALITLLLWIYYSGQILFVGAVGMHVYGENHSIDYKPKRLSLKRTTVHIDGSDIKGGLAAAWLRGFNKEINRKDD